MKHRTISGVNIFTLTLFLVGSALASPITSIPVGAVPGFVAVNQTTNRIYVSNLNSNNVSVIDGATNTVIATVPVGNSPTGIDVNAATNSIYVANSGGNSVSVIDGLTNTVSATISGMSSPLRLSVNTATNQVFVSNFDTNSVSVIDGQNNTVTVSVQVGNGPAGIRANSSSNLIYVANLSSGTVSVIDGATDTVSETFSLPNGASPGNVALDPVTNRLFITDGFNNVVYAVDASNGSLLKTITGGKIPFKSLAYVTMFQPGKSVMISDDSNPGSVIEFSESTYAPISALAGGNTPIGIGVNRKTGKIYVAESGNGTVNVYSQGAPTKPPR